MENPYCGPRELLLEPLILHGQPPSSLDWHFIVPSIFTGRSGFFLPCHYGGLHISLANFHFRFHHDTC
jgi:hypothetical protein